MHQQFQPPPSRAPRLLRHESSASNGSEDGSRPSLPSISNLLGIADGDRDHATKQAQQQAQLAHQQSQVIAREQRQRDMYPSHEIAPTQRPAIPPESSLRNDSIVDRAHSPLTISTGSSLAAQPYFTASSLNNMEADQQRVAQAHFMKRHSIPSHPNASPYGAVPYTTSPYASSPGALSNGSYYSPTEPSYPVPNSIYQQQRPLPSSFPPQLAPMQIQSTPSIQTGNPWEHHHYISPSSQATFPQSQDRYVCQTCNKAFSRPSSLKIHSHSHTGEKPFKCPHAACGKAFSVRSNMKRHERGCHTGPGGMAHLD
ncbi:hypothetical protein LTR08_008153 [Meristemomyces frigidus]|nr:hypothetical protein LTR08_008153 [Meristemomyces frigidus]